MPGTGARRTGVIQRTFTWPWLRAQSNWEDVWDRYGDAAGFRRLLRSDPPPEMKAAHEWFTDRIREREEAATAARYSRIPDPTGWDPGNFFDYNDGYRY